MRISIKRDDLKKVIAVSKKALPKVIIQEERGHLLCHVESDTLEILATNNDSKMRFSLPIENPSDKNFSFTLDPKKGEKLLSKIDLDTILLDYNPEKYSLKIFTTKDNKSISTLETFPVERMLDFKSNGIVERVENIVDRDVFIFSLNYAKNYLPVMKEDHKQFDFVIIDNAYVYAANGLNKMGLVHFKSLENFKNLKIRKVAVPIFIAVAKHMSEGHIKIFETEKEIGIKSEDNNIYYSCLKSNIDSPKIDTEYVRSKKPYVNINKDRLTKVLDRLIATCSSPNEAGVDITLRGSGEEATLEVSLLKSESKEFLNCVRFDESNEEINHVVNYKLFRMILASFNTKEDIRIHINEKDKKFFKIYNRDYINGNKYILAGIGAYARIIK